MNFGQWYLRRGRINRPTYWLHYFLPLVLLSIVIQFVVMLTSGVDFLAASTATPATPGVPAYVFWVPLVVALLTMVPGITSQVTRLHDRGHSAWWLLFTLLPLAGPIVLLVQMCLPGNPDANRYGPPPTSRHPVPDEPPPQTRPWQSLQ